MIPLAVVFWGTIIQLVSVLAGSPGTKRENMAYVAIAAVLADITFLVCSTFAGHALPGMLGDNVLNHSLFAISSAHRWASLAVWTSLSTPFSRSTVHRCDVAVPYFQTSVLMSTNKGSLTNR